MEKRDDQWKVNLAPLLNPQTIAIVGISGSGGGMGGSTARNLQKFGYGGRILPVNPKYEEILLEGEVPSASAPPPGCRFHQRCRFRKESCSNDKPPLVEVTKGHFVSCFL